MRYITTQYGMNTFQYAEKILLISILTYFCDIYNIIYSLCMHIHIQNDIVTGRFVSLQ